MKRRMPPWGASFGRERSSDSVAMASGTPDVTNQEPAEVQEEGSGKKKSKFQTFKKLFARKKRKEPSVAGGDDGLKASQSSDNVSKASEKNALTRAEKEKGSGSKVSLGSKALSHDSVFVSESSEANEALGASQDSIHGKVKSLQLQLKQAIRLGSPPSLMCVKKTEDAGTMSEDDGLPCSPPECTTPHAVMHPAQRNSSSSLQGADSDDEQLSRAASSRAVSPLVVPGDFSQPASPFGCLDNSAARHKLGLRHQACNKRKPGRRLEVKAERDSAVEDMVDISILGAETEDLKEPEDVGDEQLKPESEKEEDEDDEKGLPRDSSISLSTDEEKREKREEGEDESEAEQDVSHDPDASCPPTPSLDDQLSSKISSGASSPDSPRATPEPPAGPGEDLLDPPDSEPEEELVQEMEEEESSLLEEVMNSLKTPLTSRSVDAEPEGVVMETEEVEGEDDKPEEPVGHQPPDSVLQDQAAEEEEEEEEKEEEDEEEKEEEEEEEEVTVVGEEEEEEEDLIVERFSQHADEEEGQEEEEGKEEEEKEEEEEKPEIFMPTRQEISQQEEEEEPIELEKEPEVQEKTEKPDDDDDDDGVDDDGDDDDDDDDEDGQMAVEMNEKRDVEEEEMVPDSPGEEGAFGSVPEAEGDEAVGDSVIHKPKHEDGEETPRLQEGGGDLGGQGEKDEEEALMEPGEEEEEEWHEAPELVAASSEPLPESPPGEAAAPSPPSPPGPLGPPGPPSRTSTLQINLVSPSVEKAALSFQLPDPSESSPPPSADSSKTNASPDPKEEGKRSNQEPEDPDPAPEGEAVTTPTDQSRTRFTIAPAWQRSHSSSPPDSPPAPVSSSSEPETPAGNDPVGKAERGGSAEAEAPLSPGAGIKPPSDSAPPPVKPPTPAAAESAAVADGNHDNPFGVRLRKTSALLRFGSEEENPEMEPPSESPSQPISCKADSPQPVSNKPAVFQPISIKPALPRKPEVQVDAGGKPRRISDPAPGRGLSGGADPPSWISVAKQKQRIYKENSLEETPAIKEEQERKSSLPTYVSSAASREQSNKTAESTSKVVQSGVSKETRRTLSPPTPVPPQPSKSQPPPCPVAPKPQLPPTLGKHPAQPDSPRRALSPPTPVPVSSCTTPCLSKSATSPKTVTSPPFSSRTVPEKPGAKAPGGAASPQRGPPTPTLPQDEPPWMALAKKKAKAWSEMPQIVQ